MSRRKATVPKRCQETDRGRLHMPKVETRNRVPVMQSGQDE